MTRTLIETKIFPKEVYFKPGDQPVEFEVMVVNDSDQFASFQLEILAAGSQDTAQFNWYEISPEISTKKPPGDITQFHISIIENPVPGFVGLMNLTVRIFSVELRQENREILRLFVEPGLGSIPLKLNLPVRNFYVYPGHQVEVPVTAYNSGQLPTYASLELSQIDPTWFLDERKRSLQIPAGKQVETSFLIQPPARLNVASEPYPFRVEATHNNGPPTYVEGMIEILPMGSMELICSPQKQTIPSKFFWKFWKSESAIYELYLKNNSNLHQLGSVEILETPTEQLHLETIPHMSQIEPEETAQLQLIASIRRSWLGRTQKLLLPIKSVWSDQRLDTKNETQNLELNIKPIIPLWLLICGSILVFWLIWWLSWLNPRNPFFGHQDSVTSVQFNGVGDKIVSSSNDQTIILWRVDGFFSPFINQEVREIGRTDKAVRVLRYRPVNNNIIAAGLENGTIQLWNLLNPVKEPLAEFSYQSDDRVLTLEFTQNSRYLFSGHGSGLVLQWDVQYQTSDSFPQKPIRQQQFDFAIYDIKFVGNDESKLMVGGRYNQLFLWNLNDNQVRKIPYRPGSQNDYIFSIDQPEFNPYRLVTADNQGHITLWNLRNCLTKNEACEILDEWSNGHGGKAVRSVAFSADGCYLASAGDDGKVRFWPLTSEGQRSQAFLDGQEITHSFNTEKMNTLDIKVVNNLLLIATGSEDSVVRVTRKKRLPKLGCDQF
jgi:WD40 repeat protein